VAKTETEVSSLKKDIFMRKNAEEFNEMFDGEKMSNLKMNIFIIYKNIYE